MNTSFTFSVPFVITSLQGAMYKSGNVTWCQRVGGVEHSSINAFCEPRQSKCLYFPLEERKNYTTISDTYTRYRCIYASKILVFDNCLFWKFYFCIILIFRKKLAFWIFLFPFYDWYLFFQFLSALVILIQGIQLQNDKLHLPFTNTKEHL